MLVARFRCSARCLATGVVDKLAPQPAEDATTNPSDTRTDTGDLASAQATDRERALKLTAPVTYSPRARSSVG